MKPSFAQIVIALFIAELSATFEGAMVYAALPKLMREFGDPATVAWLVTGHLLVAAGASVVAGRLGDIWGRQRMILAMLAIATLGSLISVLATGFATLLIGRSIQGFAAAILPLSIGVARESLHKDRIAVAVGIIISSTAGGTAAGLVLGGLIVDHFHWHWMFAASGLLLFVSMLVVMWFVPARPGIAPTAPIDWVEGLLPIPAITAILLAVSLSRDYGWLSPRILALLVVGSILLAIWARKSLRAADPFVDLRLLANREVAVANAISVLSALGASQVVLVFSTLAQAPRWTHVGLGLSATVAGLLKLPSNILALGAGPFAGWLAWRWHSRLALLVGTSIATIGWLIATILPDSLGQVVAILCIISFGTTMGTATVPHVIVSAVSPGRTSEAIGLMTVIRGIFIAIGSQIVAVLLSAHTLATPDGRGHFPTAGSFRMAMMWIAALCIGGVLASLLLPPRRELDWADSHQEDMV